VSKITTRSWVEVELLIVGPFRREQSWTNKKPPGPSGRRRLGEHLCGALALTKEKLLGREGSLHNRLTWSQYDRRLVKAIVHLVFRRLLRLTVKVGLIALVGFAIATVVKRLTAPADAPLPVEPWTTPSPDRDPAETVVS
jgi:hypothetical protein